jgi:hypothetical protein
MEQIKTDIFITDVIRKIIEGIDPKLNVTSDNEKEA